MIRIWDPTDPDDLADKFDLPWRSLPSYTDDVKAIATTFDVIAQVDVRPGLPRIEKSVRLRGPGSQLDNIRCTTGGYLRAFLLAAWKNKTLLTVFDDDFGRFWIGRLAEEAEDLLGNLTYWPGDDNGKVELQLNLTGRGTYLDFGNGSDSLSYAILSADTASDQFEVAGDYTAVFTVGRPFTVSGSTGNDGAWATASSTYSSGTGRTTIQTTNVADDTDDGTITVTGNLTEDAV